MKVSELIKLLSEAPQELEVVVAGYEGGLDSVTGAYVDYLELNVNTEEWVGLHEKKDKKDVKETERPNGLILRSTRYERK